MSTNLLFKHFATLTTAPGGIDRLREIILLLALQGKLGTQDEKDERASSLLEIIIADKKSKYGKNTNIDDVHEENHPYRIPQNWIWTKVGDIYNIISGGTPSTRIDVYWNGTIPWITCADIYGLKDIRPRKKINENAIKNSATNLVPKGSIIVVTRVGLGKIALTDTPICFSQDSQALIGNNTLINPNYALYYLSKAVQIFKSQNRGTTIFGVTKKQLYNLPFALPPLSEQHRIVIKVDRLMAFCDELETWQQQEWERCIRLGAASLSGLTNAESDEEFEQYWEQVCDTFDLLLDYPDNVIKLRQTILQLAVQGRLVRQEPCDEPAERLVERLHKEKEKAIKTSKISKKFAFERTENEDKIIPYHIPSSWKWIQLGVLCELITKGSSPKWQGVNYIEEANGILFITSENVDNFKLKFVNKKFVERKFNEIEPRSILKRNDILMNIVGASIGRTAIFNSDEIANINQAVCLIRICNGNQFINLRYLLLFFNSPVCISYMFDNQVDNARANLSMTNIANFLVPIPPLAEQHRIVAKVDALMALCDLLEARLQERNDIQGKYANAMVKQLASE